jgi:adenylate kinase family enzyme
VLSAADPLPELPRRITVAGVSGSGKTTLAGRISDLLDVPHVEIDALFHGPGWVPRESFLEDVRRLVASDAWVTEWQYSAARPLLSERAQLLVWLDLPFWRTTFPRVMRRTLRRRLRRQALWNGNIEPPLRTFLSDREHIVRWAIATRKTYRSRIPELAGRSPDLVVVRLRSAREVERWLGGPLAAVTTDVT